MDDWRSCATCGVENSADDEVCAICADERQWVPADGQRWTTLAERSAEGCRIELTEFEPDLFGLTARPQADIGQTALLVRTPAGNLLWDVPGFIDAAAVTAVADLGGIAAIMASHPHMYGVQLEWARAFGAPVWVNARDRHWVRREGPELRTWDEPFEVLPGVRAIRFGGHFRGSAVVEWAAGADGRGVLLAGDTIAAVPASGWVSFARSFPNRIPLSAGVVARLAESASRLRFDRLYSNFGGVVRADAAAAVQRSAERHIAWVSGANDDDT